MNRRYVLGLAIGIIFAVPLGWGKANSATVEEVTPVAVQAGQGDLVGAVAAYHKQYDPMTPQGLIALRQLAIEILHLGLRLSEPHERNVVAEVLGRRGDYAALLVLDEALYSDKPMLRRTAVDALGEMATAGAVNRLRRLYSTDVEGKRLALSGLRRTRDKTAVWIYLDAANSPDPRIRTQGVGGLGELREPAAKPVLQTLLKTEKDPVIAATIAWSLASMGDSGGLAYLTAKLTDKDEQVRDAVVGLLGSLDDPSVVSLLRTVMMNEPSVMVRTTAAASLTHFGDANGLPLVQEALEHVDFRVRLGAALSFSRMHYATAKSIIVEAMNSGDPLVRTSAFKVVGENRDRSATPLVVKAIGRETDFYAKAQALWTLGQIGGAESLLMLLDLLHEDMEEVRHASAEAIVLITDRLLDEKK